MKQILLTISLIFGATAISANDKPFAVGIALIHGDNPEFNTLPDSI